MTRHEFAENLSVAVETLRTHKVRSALTVLGIVIGVTSVISVAAIIDGLNGYISQRVEQMGSRTFFVMRVAGSLGRIPEKMQRRKYIVAGTAEYLAEACTSCEVVEAFGARPGPGGGLNTDQSNELRYGSEKVDSVILRGFGPDIPRVIPLVSVARGRFLTRFDEDHAREVIVLGDAIANALFPGGIDPLGKVVRLNGHLMEVIGIMDQDPGLFGTPGMDQIAVIPFSTFRKYHPEYKDFMIAFAARKDVDTAVASNEVIDALRRYRKVPYSEENDFEVLSPDFLNNLWGQLTGALVALTGAISSVGLLVGGVGVMNIMLISVTERTAEIGIRKAVGARRSDIRIQFLMEAMVISCLGGVLGLAGGGAVAFAVNLLVPTVPATVSFLWVFLGVGISAGIGLFFGYYPASRAANLDPIVCLRYE
jgi:putative ABC transport system permease protein